MIEQNTVKRRFYVVPPLNAQYEEVQPDLHSLFIFNGVFGANVSFGGTSIIIIVGVILETVKQIESQLLVRNYKGFLNN